MYGSVDEEKASIPHVPSLEHIFPEADSLQRQTSLWTAVFSLITTIIGGGVLSLPYAFSKAGIIFGSALLVVVALTSNFSIYVLVCCARKSGGNSYEEVAYQAFGRPAQILTIVLMFFVIFLSIIAYCILMRDLFVPLAEMAFNTTLSYLMHQVVMLACVTSIFPVCLMHSLKDMRFTSILSISAIMLLAVAIVVKTLTRVEASHVTQQIMNSSLSPTSAMASATTSLAALAHRSSTPTLVPAVSPEQTPFSSVHFFPSSLQDLVFSLPLVCVSYLCHFNVLPLHMELVRPTRVRIKNMINTVVGMVSALYFVVGLFGFMYAGKQTKGNILNNFAPRDPLMSCGRAGLGLTILLSFPLLILPCRLTIDRLVGLCREWKINNEYHSVSSPQKRARARSMSFNVEAEGVIHLPSRHFLYHTLQTFLIVICAVILAVFVPDIATIWSIMGSTCALFIAYILPGAFYLKLRWNKHFSAMKVGCWGLVIGGWTVLIICSYSSISNLFADAGKGHNPSVPAR